MTTIPGSTFIIGPRISVLVKMNISMARRSSFLRISPVIFKHRAPTRRPDHPDGSTWSLVARWVTDLSQTVGKQSHSQPAQAQVTAGALSMYLCVPWLHGSSSRLPELILGPVLNPSLLVRRFLIACLLLFLSGSVLHSMCVSGFCTCAFLLAVMAVRRSDLSL